MMDPIIRKARRALGISAKRGEDHVLLLRTCAADMTSYAGFRWPESGLVEAPDWSPEPERGHGLHGALWGEGGGEQLSWAIDARWLVVAARAADVVDLEGKVKVPRGYVVHCGDQASATACIVAHGATGAVIGAQIATGNAGIATAGYRGVATAGDGGTATAGDGGVATAGYRGTATAGNAGIATAGYRGVATAGYRGIATAGPGGIATAGNGGTATAGNAGIATAGNAGIATAGCGGIATAGDYGVATAGYRGIATAGCGGTATAGCGGEIRIRYWDQARRRTVVGYPGEDAVLPDVAYYVENGRLVRHRESEATPKERKT